MTMMTPGARWVGQSVDIVHTLILILPDKDSKNMTVMTPRAGWGGQSVDIVRSSSSAEPQVIDSQSWCLRDTLAQNNDDDDDDGNVDDYSYSEGK